MFGGQKDGHELALDNPEKQNRSNAQTGFGQSRRFGSDANSPNCHTKHDDKDLISGLKKQSELFKRKAKEHKAASNSQVEGKRQVVDDQDSHFRRQKKLSMLKNDNDENKEDKKQLRLCNQRSSSLAHFDHGAKQNA